MIRSLRLLSLLALALICASHCAAEPTLVKMAGKQVASFLDTFSQVRCSEEVTQTKIPTKGSPGYEEKQTFDYLVIATGSEDDLTIQESRLAQHSSTRKKNLPLLVTNGFATLSLIFHPYYQSAFEFSEPTLETRNGRQLAKITFRHRTGQRTTAVLMLRGKDYPLELTGSAWLDPATGVVVSIQAELQDDMSDIGLQLMRASVDYEPVLLPDMKTPAWLPATAQVELKTPKQHWRNVHRFSKYQEFSVSTNETVKN